jgi:ABC-type uncharacterized transport system permease subunit
LQMLPYVVTMLVLAALIGRSTARVDSAPLRPGEA